MTHVLRCGSRDKAYVPGAKPKAELEALDKELLELVAELQPTPEERQRQQVRCTGHLAGAERHCRLGSDAHMYTCIHVTQSVLSWLLMQRTLSPASVLLAPA